ncbi:macro domain-containing protein [Planctellipticum variicoloris]|uniref:type II toxin-antitoxin system antitoxin DNA ADP-ribosyl glycohydrolase DarG n=1 Tax=Planctellipticum variicoloris TaxID=3064265 RepID=UPI003013257D|nr:macro domain-containing protein [Planctomycetaceae bacterium SH412]
MIRYTTGNLLEDPSEALVNTVNEVGVMGKGIALMFREEFPENTRAYVEACKAGTLQVGKMLVTVQKELVGPKWVINFPTKKHWRNPSKMEWIRSGLKDLVRVIRESGIRSIAVPPLGCGNGGLEWSQVRQEIETAFAELPNVDVTVYAPTSEYQNTAKRSGLTELTPARALVAELVRRYSVLGLDCTNLEVQKLAWFLHRSSIRQGLSDPLDLRFSANKYGPYADSLRHLLDGLDGSYLHCEKRLADAGPFDLIWFEDSQRERVVSYLQEQPAATYAGALEHTAEIIDGFESPLGLELLATVDWLLSKQRAAPTVDSLRGALAEWPAGHAAGRRKQKLFDDRLLTLALDRLQRAMPPVDEDSMTPHVEVEL